MNTFLNEFVNTQKSFSQVMTTQPLKQRDPLEQQSKMHFQMEFKSPTNGFQIPLVRPDMG